MRSSEQPIRDVTLKDVAAAAGLSPSGVSLALRNSPSVSAQTCQRVQQIARDMGYRPNAAAKNLTHFRKASKTPPVRAAIAWLNFWHNQKDFLGIPEFTDWLSGSEKSAERLGYSLAAFDCSRMAPARLEKILSARGITGLLLPPFPYTAHPFPDTYNQFPWERFSIVRLGRRLEGPRVHFVTAAQAANTILAVQKMKERGYKRISFVGSDDQVRMFGAGYFWAIRHLPAREQLNPFLFTGAFRDRRKPFEAWLRREKPDGILTDQPELPSFLRQAGYRVPEDIGVASTNVFRCPIDAGIDQKPEEIGRAAALLLISLMGENDRGCPSTCREVLVQGEWVDGASLPWR